MTTDPRVKVVAEALDFLYGTDDLIPDWTGHAVVAVAALDAYDAEHRPEVSEIGAESWANLLRVIENRDADLRERIALDLTSCACSKCEAAGRRLRSNGHAACGYWLSAARIARGAS